MIALLWQLAIVADPSLMRYLGNVTLTAANEPTRCVMGRIERDTVWVNAVAETPWLVQGSTPKGVGLEWWKCPRGTIGTWHGHVPLTAHTLPQERCFMSGPDSSRVRRRNTPLLFLVSSRPDVWCAWVRDPEGRLR